MTADSLARNARLFFGLGWHRSTLTRIELGQRQLTAAELLVLPALYGRALVELLPTEAAALTDVVAVGPGELSRALTQTPRLRSWHLPELNATMRKAVEALPAAVAKIEARFPGVPFAAVVDAARGWGDEATRKAARRLQVSAEDVAVASHQLWSRGLAAERDRRLAAGGGAGDKRVRQARRGHITRALLEELRPVVEEMTRSRKREGES